MDDSAPAQRKGNWSPDKIETLKREYPQARDDGTVRELAERLGVETYDVYNKAHRLGLARRIRRR